MSFIVAIDGPAGSGKGTITSAVAEKFNLMYLDTGATYRCVALKILKEKVKLDDIEKIKEILANIKIEFKEDKTVLLDGEDVTKAIREPDVTNTVSPVSHILEVRLAMVDLQRKIASGKDSILEGRDIGTNVFPNADVKIYLDASVEERVKRRVKQNAEKGIEMTEEEVRQNIISRDENDKSAEVGPLKQAEDAIYIDSSNLSIKQVIKKISKIVKKARKDYEAIEKGYENKENTKWKLIQRGFVSAVGGALYHLVFRVKNINNKILMDHKDEGIIICANHVNYFDSIGIAWCNKKREITFVAKNDLWTHKFLAWIGNIYNGIPVKRDSSDLKSIKLILKALKNNVAVGIYPEGTRNGMAKHVEIKDGAVFMAHKAKVKIIPLGISGSFKPFSKVTFNYGEPIDVNDYKTDDKDWMKNATKAVMDEIVRLTKVK